MVLLGIGLMRIDLWAIGLLEVSLLLRELRDLAWWHGLSMSCWRWAGLLLLLLLLLLEIGRHLHVLLLWQLLLLLLLLVPLQVELGVGLLCLRRLATFDFDLWLIFHLWLRRHVIGRRGGLLLGRRLLSI